VSAAGVGTILAVVSAVVWALAAGGKVVRHRETTAAFAGLGIGAPGAVAVAVPAAELAVAVVLLVRPVVGGVLALALLGVFTTVIVRALLRGVDTGCGCFGERRPSPLGPADVVRNGLLAAFAALATGAHTLISPSAGDIVIGIAAVVVAGAVLGVAQRRLTGSPRRAEA